MSTVSEFRTAIAAGVVRQNRWGVTVNFPIFAGTGDTSRLTRALARTADVPASTLGVMEVAYSGRNVPLPGDRQYGEFTLNILATNDFVSRDSFERWSEGINGSESNNGLVALDSFVTDLQLDLLDINDNVTKTYILQDAWPTAVGQMQLDMSSQDSFAEFPVTFRYINLASNTTR
jgi:hypothetical protein